MSTPNRSWIESVHDDEVVLPPLWYEGEPHYFSHASELAEYLRKNGIKGRKTHPEAPEGVMHFDVGIDFPAVFIAFAAIAEQASFQITLSVIGSFIYDKLKAFGKKDKYGREVIAQFELCTRLPNGRDVSIKYKGSADEYRRFVEADHSRLFQSLPLEKQEVPVEKAKYVSLFHRDVYHFPSCSAICDDIESELADKFVGFPSAASAVLSKRRPCKNCQPPWVDSE